MTGAPASGHRHRCPAGRRAGAGPGSMSTTSAIVAAALLLALLPGSVSAHLSGEDSLRGCFSFGDPTPFGFLLAYFPPLLVQRGIELKEFIRDTAFLSIRRTYGDTRAVDAVFCRSMRMTENNTAMALLLSAIATMDHRVIGVKSRVFRLFFPLSDESVGEFSLRLAHLPSRIYADSPGGVPGDRDKLQHFFGSAFLTFAFESRESADRIGMSVETGEEIFIVGGVNDPRDVRANRQGQRFGLALLADAHRLPSEFLTPLRRARPQDTTRSQPQKDMRKEHP